MTSLRLLGLSFVIAGISAGTVLGTDRPREIPRANGYLILAGDFHVHAAVGDGAVPPWELAREARRRGLDVIVVTNHNQRLAAELATTRLAPRRSAPDTSDPIVIVGQELTTPGFHMIAAGISKTIDWRLSASDAIRAIHAQGGVAIAAHPIVGSWRAEPEAMALLDGAEVLHPLVFRSPTEAQELLQFYRTAAARNPSLAPIGSSDFHFGGTLGICRTFLFVRDASQEGVLEAIREGRTVARARGGRLIGEPARVAIVEGLIASNPPRARADIPSRIAGWVTLLGLLVLVLWR